MIFFDNVSKIYSPTSVALKNVSIRIQPKEFVSIVGQSGAGKSTLLKLLIAEEKPTEGRIFLDGEEVTALPRSELPRVRRRVGAIFQDYRLLPGKTAAENVAFAMEAAGRPEEEIRQNVPEVLEIVGLLDKMNNFPHELSGGEKQRVAIARALVNQPDVIMADEPTGNLDPVNTWDIVRLLERINELGTTVILATHDKQIVDHLGRRVISLEKGAVVRDEEKGKYHI
ncbi:MAG: cell division ATP-binding protein FtsE [Candidatus Sungiibacteriota bacterium]